MGVTMGVKVVLLELLLLAAASRGGEEAEDGGKVQFEAAFQGQCGHGSPCEQLCYELHDGMYECDCKEGFILREDGYSCYEINSTSSPQSLDSPGPGELIEEDVFYQKDAVFDAVELAITNTTDSNGIPQYVPTNTTSSITSFVSEERRSDLLGETDAGNRFPGDEVSLRSNGHRNHVEDYSEEESENSVYERVAADGLARSTTQGPSLEQKLTDISGVPRSTVPISTERPCGLDCGLGGGCVLSELSEPRCLCPLGKGGEKCEANVEIRSPRFTGSSWLAFPALRGAYKHVQVSLELRPEAYDGIFFLTGERDDMAGDFMALLLHQGFLEFRFDCGSGIGILRSDETVLLNQWNRVTLYRHRWDAWLQLNGGRHVQGRSKGLFSRITFREPLFIGGAGNTTGLQDKLPVGVGFKGCIRHLEVNDHGYRFGLDPRGEARKGYGIEECTADRCSRVPCQHGGKCLTDDSSAVCVCPLGFSGDLCEIRVDLQVPAFNGSSHLRYRGLAETALTWLDLEITLKPTAPEGLILYNGHRVDGTGDFMALYLDKGFVAFAFNLGTGIGMARSRHKVEMGEWHQVRISRTGRLAILSIDNQIPVEVLSPGAFTQLSLPQNLYLGGVPNFGMISPQVKIHSAFVGCVQMVKINGRSIPILAEALGGANVDNCPHPCVARPCGEDGECIPQLDYFTCRCKPGYRDQLCSRGPPAFKGIDSYIHFNDPQTMEALTLDPIDVNVRFKLSSENGLLLWLNSGASSFLSLGLERGALVLRYTDKGEEIVVVHNSTTVHDNLWHRVKAVRDGSTGILVVDNGPALTRQSVQIPQRSITVKEEEGLYVGGMPEVILRSLTGYRRGIKGCVADLVLNADYHIQLINHSQEAHTIGECEI